MSFFLSFFGLKLTPWWEAGWCCVVSQPPALRHLLLGLQPVFLLPLDARPSAPPPTWAPPLRLQSWGAEQRRSAVEGLGSVAPEEGVQAGRAPERPEEGSPGHQESSPGQQRGPRRGAGRGSVQDGRWCAMDGGERETAARGEAGCRTEGSPAPPAAVPAAPLGPGTARSEEHTV